jgi:hypothetical protein
VSQASLDGFQFDLDMLFVQVGCVQHTDTLRKNNASLAWPAEVGRPRLSEFVRGRRRPSSVARTHSPAS